MSYYYETRISNILFDRLLPELTESELKVLLVIIRQTLGWIDKRTNKPKEWDWISILFFAKKTGLSKRAIGYAIHSLFLKRLIRIKNEHGKLTPTAKMRKNSKKLFYQATLNKKDLS